MTATNRSPERPKKLATKQQVFEYIDQCVASPVWDPRELDAAPVKTEIQKLCPSKLQDLIESTGFEYDASKNYDKLLKAINKQVNFLNHLYNAEVLNEPVTAQQDDNLQQQCLQNKGNDVVSSVPA